MHPSTARLTKAILTWLLVAAPLVWGVTRSVQKSLPLFTGKSKTTAPAMPPK